ncbi:MAG: hypothetical protein NT007_06285 [Candidatus Kapabacteria bacterium]|nr:hypothetical protein [Candidatus Kapabacteria bacterium]
MSTSRIDNLRMVDPVLSTLVQGYSNGAMVADLLFPVVQVSKLKGKIPVFGREAFVVRDTFRAIRADSNRIPPADVQLISFETKERDIEIAVDYIEEEETPEFLRYEQRLSKELMDILLLGREKEIADLVQNTANFASDMRIALTSDTAFNNYTGLSDPVAIIREGAAAVRNKISKYPNTMIIGDASYQALLQHPKILERIKYAGISKVTTDILAQLLDIPDIHVGLGVYSNDGVNFSDVWSDNVVLAYVDKSSTDVRSEFNPGFGYTLQREGNPQVDSYYENGGKIKVIRCTNNYGVQITCQDAAYLISGTNDENLIQ